MSKRPTPERRAEVLAADSLNGKPLKHGRMSTYTYWGCPCPRCREANNVYHREYQPKRRARKKAASA